MSPATEGETAARHAADRPHGAVLALACLVLAAAPALAMAGLGEVGGHRMFTRLAHVRLELVAIGDDGVESNVEAAELAPHLGRDAERVITAALGMGTLGDAEAATVRSASEPLAALICALDAQRRTIRVTTLMTAPGNAIEPALLEVEFPCPD